ncbi:MULTISPECIES: hypothetical protein [unclassified Pseudonocardia]|uniref:hypothetical protein n=1 Tax=unclassified Pseudonocardia TaxID=2619320 RepID=UPI0008152084|nr:MULTISPECIES: hypothetical protein [unclassified Pseudonocardia]ANY10745.1 hypothetical protein AFB00_30555 [Pseudonocardia sp. HH130630-07]
MSDCQPRELTAAVAAGGLVPVTDLDGGPLSAEETAYGQASKAPATTGWPRSRPPTCPSYTGSPPGCAVTTTPSAPV